MIIDNKGRISEKGGKMPYISVKAFPMDEETKRKTAEQILEVFQKTWGAEPEWVSISMEDIDPEEWDDRVRNAEILPNRDKLMILDGVKQYKS